MLRSRFISAIHEMEAAALSNLNRRFPRKKQVRFAIWVCALATIGSLLSAALWSPLILVPVLNFMAIPNIIACALILLYAIPALAYLLLAQRDPPSSSTQRLFLPLNPMRNLRVVLSTTRYSWFLVETVPLWLWCVARYVLWEQLLRKIGEHLGASKNNDVSLEEKGGTTSSLDLFEGFASFGVEFARHDGHSSLLDIYLPHPPVAAAVQRSLSSTGIKSSPRRPIRPVPSTAPDTDTTSPRSNHLQAQISSSPLSSNTPTPKVTPRKLPEEVIASSPASSTPPTPPRSLKPVIVFINDVGMLGPILPNRQMWMLLGVKLAEMGYVSVIPSITNYPSGKAETMVRDIRETLRWVHQHIHKYGGDSNKLYLAGHGLGAHLALFTLAQDAVVHSRDDRAKSTTLEMKTRRLPNGFGGTARPMAQEIPNGLKNMKIYANDIPIPYVRGVILLSPVTDIIKQIRHESSLYLEHLSPLRRMLGPSQTTCMRNSLGHLLFAAKNMLQPHRLPPRILIMHGAQDKLVPLEGAHWLSELLYGLDIQTTFRPYRSLGHWDLLMGLMKGMEGDYSPWLEKDLRTFIR